MKLKSVLLVLGIGALLIGASLYFYQPATVILYLQLVLFVVGYVFLALGLILLGLWIFSIVVARILPRPKPPVIKVRKRKRRRKR